MPHLPHLTTKDPDGKHPLDAPPSPVEGVNAGIPGGMTDAMSEAEAKRVADAPVTGGELDMSYVAVQDLTDYEVEPPPASARIVPYTATGANPSYPQDAVAGFENAEASAPASEPVPAAKKAAPEPEVEELNPAGIPAPPD